MEPSMQPMTSFTLAQHSGPYESWPSRTQLFLDGRDTGSAITGYVVEGQYQYADGYLLITSHDCPFEETSSFVLLDWSFRHLATKNLFVPYGSFMIHTHWPIAPLVLRLHYYESLFYTLTIRKTDNVFGVKHKLDLALFAEHERDPQAIASLNELQQSLEKIRQRLSQDASDQAS
jgi:hypothetical protein